jgi:NhaA family Na+:H+ antiporter
MASSPVNFIQSFLKAEAAGGVLLMVVAVIALVMANSPADDVYFRLLETEFAGVTVLHWINDGLMALFFLLVGLEIKRELRDGQLETWPSRALPGIAALGGMLLPGAIYLSLNAGAGGAPRGWAIPAATDIAFALGVLALLGSRVPVPLKIFLTALAILDDLGAVLIIAFFYTGDLHLWALIGVAIVTAALLVMNRAGVVALSLYLIAGGALWFFMLKSGIHATVAGVILAFAIPLQTPGVDEPPLLRLEHGLHPWVAFLILPIFGLANAGVSLQGLDLAGFLKPVPAGIALGLFLGKQIGVFAFAWITIRLGGVPLPAGANWTQLYGISVLCGIGFTMSLFIGSLAFATDPPLQDATKIGVLTGSIVSAIVGALVLLLPAKKGR